MNSDKLSWLFRRIKNPRIVKRLVSFTYRDYLHETGWFESFLRKRAVDSDGEPIPWTTYAFWRFIEPRLTTQLRVFEYGAGSSTLYFAGRVGTLTTVEHDRAWYERLLREVPSNVELLYRELGEQYVNASGVPHYDLVSVDGRMRVECLTHAQNALSPRGVVVLDDSERHEYQPGTEHLKNLGFRRVDFWGISPGLFYEKCTSVFYRDENCINL